MPSTSDSMAAMWRRSLLRTMLGGAALACPACVALARTGAAAEQHWGYEGEHGPDHWSELGDEARVCGMGHEQSPIDLAHAIRAELDPLALKWGETGLHILNNGHTVQCNCDAGSSFTVDGVAYELKQFHFHHPSEHAIAGKRSEMEAHFVHRTGSGDLAVLGVMIVPGEANAALAPVFDAMPMQPAAEATVKGVMLDLAAMLPEKRTYFRYYGSLTTPPCSEGVVWTVLEAPVAASSEQIGKFAKAFSGNARPLQQRYRRFLLESS